MLSIITTILTAFGCLDARQAVSASFSQDSFVSGELTSDSCICLTPGCVKTASDILRNLDESVDPCDDFYQFACGGWEARHPIPENKGSVDVFSELQNELNLQLRALLEKKLNGTEPDFIRMVKDLYDSCMDDNAIEAAGSGPLEKVLKSLGGWPVVEGNKWNESNFDWIDVLSTLKKHGLFSDIILSLAVMPDLRNSKFNSIYLAQTTIGMPDKDYFLRGLNDTAISEYFKLMVNSAEKLGANRQKAEEELAETLKFEITLANWTRSRNEIRNVNQLYNRYTVKELTELAPQINWLKFFNGLLPRPISENQSIIVQTPDYIFQLDKLLPDTNKRVLANYMMWRVTFSIIDFLSKDWRDLEQAYTTAITGKPQESPRWAECLYTVKDNLGIAFSSYYVRHNFNDESKESALELVEYIRQAFVNILKRTEWMGETAKMRAIEKAKKVKPYIGYPQELLNDTLVSPIYNHLTLTNDSYFDNIMRLKIWSTPGGTSEELLQFDATERWENHAVILSINANYRVLENSIVFPAGILQYPFFDKNRPNFLNAGAIGTIIGHEFTHGFDDIGRQFDADGNNVDWWDDLTNQMFNEKAMCFVEQYGNYTIENGMRINGVNTLGENIADNGGLKEAYLAYQSWVNDHGTEPTLPGLKYTPNQLFFISMANNWCAKYRPEKLKRIIITDEHSPNQYRVNGPMSNLPQFSEEFQCEIGTKMNPEHKCNVW
ncbi:hypothetical protein JTE90_003861 [Oedothorax gibbosus]|uniref:Membrane metallo-endopeptidase-like 1 n=1 Tax=Oedothorax gibbosus TaxID=931172 RepID=A0AAV6UJS0_9ARAC|nr:hypothetical protein JTE90_003861 [Oedothorax gibbosus]